MRCGRKWLSLFSSYCCQSKISDAAEMPPLDWYINNVLLDTVNCVGCVMAITFNTETNHVVYIVCNWVHSSTEVHASIVSFIRRLSYRIKIEKKQFRGKKLTFDFCSTTKFRPYTLKVSSHLGDERQNSIHCLQWISLANDFCFYRFFCLFAQSNVVFATILVFAWDS